MTKAEPTMEEMFGAMGIELKDRKLTPTEQAGKKAVDQAKAMLEKYKKPTN
jgi:hypothetical protein